MILDPDIRITAEEGRGTRHELFLAGKSVSRLAVWDLRMRVGSVPVRMGGIGGVATEREYRMRGLSRRVMENSTRWMAAEGFDCATLFGIRDFYDKYGYAACMLVPRFEVRTRDAERARGSLTVRPYEDGDREAVRALYEAGNDGLTGTICRGEGWKGFRKGSDYFTSTEVVVFCDAGARVAAYAGRDQTEERVRVFEAGAAAPGYYADVVRWAAERAVELRLERISFCCPADHALADHLTWYGAHIEADFPRCSSGMGRLIDLSRFMTATLPEWTRRLRDGSTLRPGASVRFATDIGAVTLRWTGEEARLDADERADGDVRLPQWLLFQMAMGYRTPEVALAHPEAQSAGDLRLLPALFPRRWPTMWPADHF
jgi:hypothetical protein